MTDDVEVTVTLGENDYHFRLCNMDIFRYVSTN